MKSYIPIIKYEKDEVFGKTLNLYNREGTFLEFIELFTQESSNPYTWVSVELAQLLEYCEEDMPYNAYI